MMRRFLQDAFWLPRIVWLWALTVSNYRKRQIGVLPDEWFWADAELFERGWYVTHRYALKRFTK